MPTATTSTTCPPTTLPALLQSVTHPSASASVSTSTQTPAAATVPKRADLLSLKLKLADLLPPHLGQLYWTSLVEFMCGQINRDELQAVFERVFVKRNEGEHDTAPQLHNALLLSILYNTTRIAVPPSTLRHSGFQIKRRPGGSTSDLTQTTSDVDPLRKKLKTLVMSFGKRERREIKALVPSPTGVGPIAASTTSAASVIQQQDQAQLHAIREAGGVVPSALAKRELERERDRKRDKELVRLRTLGAALKSGTRRGGVDGIGGKSDPAIIQEYQRIIASSSSKDSLLCSTSKVLPDVDGLRDRMTLVAFESGLVGAGIVDERVGLLAVQAVEASWIRGLQVGGAHLKNIIANVVGLVRSDRDKGIRTSSITKEQLAIFDAARPVRRQVQEGDAQAGKGEFKMEQSFDPIKAVGLLSLPTKHDDEEEEAQRPLTTDDFLGLFDINPSVLVVPRLGAVERSYALPPDSDDSDMTEDEEEDEEEDAAIEADDEAMMVVDEPGSIETTTTMPRFPERPRLGGKSRSKLAPVRSTSSSSTTSPGTSTLSHSRHKHPLSRSGSTSRRPSTISRSRSHRPSRSNSFSTNAATPGGGPRDQYLIDPSAVAIPQGHPDVANARSSVSIPGQTTSSTGGENASNGSRGSSMAGTLVTGMGGTGTTNKALAISTPTSSKIGNPAGADGGPNLSPKSLALRHQLFPELSVETPSSAGVEVGSFADQQMVGSPSALNRGANGGNNTSTDGGSEDDEPSGHGAQTSNNLGSMTLSMETKLGGLQGSSSNGVGSQMGSAGSVGGPGLRKKYKEQLWQVVDSVRLLDGVL
ncbi:BQ2448_2945 [Microbotryum intermedium]|uniref:BQ2448_2945 protein n=1 Tax=Microbotryum intermedium TaxID=269621 RepID=A0A238FDT8_9BASI|nr:BQ2448_2945 [Microbotryum intermedium]